MRNEIVKGHEICCIGLFKDGCKGKDCFCFITFTDRKEGLCAFEIGGAATKMIPKVVNELAGVLKKICMILLVSLLFTQFSHAQPNDTWDNNKKYIGERLDTLTKEVQALRVDLKCYSDNVAKQDTSISAQNIKLETFERVTNDLQASIKYLYSLLFLSIGGNAVSGGLLFKQRKKTINNK